MLKPLKYIFWICLLLSILSCSKKIGINEKETPKQTNDALIINDENILPIEKTEEFTRVIELRNPYMNGTDIKKLQEKLLSLGFYEPGEADGYYGTITEGIITNIQTFSGFTINGKVGKILWDYIFTETNKQFLENISTVLSYNTIELEKSGNIYNNDGLDFIIEAFVYYSFGDKNVRIVQYNRRDYYTEISRTYYLINEKYYFVKEEFSDEGSINYLNLEGIEAAVVDRILLFENNIQYEIKNGAKVISDTTYILPINKTIEDIMNIFLIEYK
ncbi:MAG: peptidoglycan-binding protein [Treponema sp.]|jgi:peptidoglycan hydrolase-like protein with peptidoglycan-binding domain|nr:peptidoglycan-binding protein [Treponema sp.]